MEKWRCADCENEVSTDELVSFNAPLCERCYERLLTASTSCGEAIWEDDARLGVDEEPYFERCHREPTIYPYDFNPKLKFHGTSEEKRFFGFELEIENTKQIHKNDYVAEKLEKAFNEFVYCKEDGSLNYGFEVVSHPFSWEWWKENRKGILEMLRSLSEMGFSSWDTKTCGLHIHVDKRCMSTLSVYKLLKFSIKHRKFLFLLSGRERTKWNTWCRIDVQDRNNIIKFAKGDSKKPTRHVAINLQPAKTIEIRMFRGSLNTVRFECCLEFVAALTEWVSLVGLTELTLDNFKKYIKAERKNYPHLFLRTVKHEDAYGD
jgi:hypothetical protein